jgi:AraC family transcriptional regulator of adaptative response/methylated-DNA-[protein]-cysteine methyltransferase
MMKQALPDQDRMYQALVNRDSGYEGIFVVGVRTTGIFCRPTCTARKPKKENVEFYASARDALHQGYRPCKICSPMGYQGEIPAWLRPLMDEIHSAPGIRLRDYDLRKRGIDPPRVRRWFKRHHGMTFQAYLRTLRIGQAFGRIQYGDKVIEAAFESGYESLSGFTESFKKTTGFSPNKSPGRTLVTVTRILTPLGPMLAGATDQGVCLLEFADRRMLETQLNRLRKRLSAELVPGTHPHFEALNAQVEAYFAGTRRGFDLPLVLPGTPFQQKVWDILRTIPYGTTRSYQQQAELAGNPQAVRAVARANGDNRIAIIIPCHRVVGKDGKLTGYGGGLWRKKYLLDLEQQNVRRKT